MYARLLSRCLGVGLAWLTTAAALAAQSTEARLAVVVADRRVHLYPSRIPGDGEGWIVLRDGVVLTPAPMTGARGPAEFSAAVGPDLPLIERITATESALAAYRRLRAGGAAAGIAQILSPRTAAALGALFVDSSVAANALHTYEARLVRLSRPDSVLRRARAAVRVVTTPIPTPSTPSARITDGLVTITWAVPRFTAAADDPVVAYAVERADSVGEFTRVSALPVMRLADRPSAFIDESAEPGRLYRYRVRAADLLGRLSAPTAAASVRAPGERGPLPPTRVAADVSDGRIRVVWETSPEPGTRGYHVERSVAGDSSFVRVTRAVVPAEAPEWTDTLVRGREVYAYRVRSVDARGRVGSPSNPTTTRALDHKAPTAPTGLVATLMPGPRVRLTWRAVGDRDLRGYEIHRAEPGDTIFARITANPIAAAVYVDTGYDGARLEPGRTYTWRVSAIDSSANRSSFAELRFAVPDDEGPEAARSLHLSNHLGRWVELTWTPSPSGDIARYDVERSVVGSAPVRVASVPAGRPLVARDTTPPRGRAARWAIVPVDTAGNRGEALADTLTFRDLTKPPAPRRVTAVRVAGATTVHWERVVSSDLRGYVVYRAERTNGPRTRLTPTPLTGLEFIDRAGTATSRYLVRAVDAAGNESDESPAAVTVERPR